MAAGTGTRPGPDASPHGARRGRRTRRAGADCRRIGDLMQPGRFSRYPASAPRQKLLSRSTPATVPNGSVLATLLPTRTCPCAERFETIQPGSEMRAFGAHDPEADLQRRKRSVQRFLVRGHQRRDASGRRGRETAAPPPATAGPGQGRSLSTRTSAPISPDPVLL